MTDAVTVLRNNGLAMPEPIVAAAAQVGLELAAAAALAQKESGGRMVWGHDPVDTGGCYVKGGPVTVANYWAYRRSATAGWQGVGITQLTYKGYIYQAEKLNPSAGAADPMTNCVVGFTALRDLMRQYGDQDGARRYNGSGSAAEAYGRDFIAKRQQWRTRLAGVGPTPAPSPSGFPTLTEDVTSDLVWQVQTFMNRVFPAYSQINAGARPPSRLGPQTVAVLTEFQRRSGIPTDPPFQVGPRTWAALTAAGFRTSTSARHRALTTDTEETPVTDPDTPSASTLEPVIKAGAIWGTLATFVISILGVLVAVGKISQEQADAVNSGVDAIGGYLPALVGSLVGIVGIVSGLVSHFTTSLVARRKVTPVPGAR